MRMIVIDVGNTSTALGLWTEKRVTRIARCDDGFAAASAALQRLAASAAVAGVAYMSVVPAVDAQWRKFCAAQLPAVPFVQISHAIFNSCPPPCGVTIDYPKPETIGADRLADATAAVERYGAPVIVCDFGTAFTAAAVTADKVWRGGVIAPGFPLMRDYLFERTAKLPRMKLGGKCPKIGRNTEEAMRFGAIVGYRGMVREITAELSRNLNDKFKLVATGGFAKWVLAGSGLDFTIDPSLTLHGAGLLGAHAINHQH